MKINFSQMTKLIAEEVVEQLMPEIRGIIKEEVGRGVRRILKENRMVVDKIDEINIPSTPIFESSSMVESNDYSSTAKEELARRAHEKSSKILSKYLKEDDPFAELIMTAEDPVAEKRLREEKIANLPMVDATEVKGSEVMPEQMDFSKHLEKMGI